MHVNIYIYIYINVWWNGWGESDFKAGWQSLKAKNRYYKKNIDTLKVRTLVRR